MIMTLPASTDASALAAAVRQLGFEAHRLLSENSCPPSELHDLTCRLAGLRGQVSPASSDSVARWIDQLEAKLRSVAIVAGDN